MSNKQLSVIMCALIAILVVFAWVTAIRCYIDDKNRMETATGVGRQTSGPVQPVTDDFPSTVLTSLNEPENGLKTPENEPVESDENVVIDKTTEVDTEVTTIEVVKIPTVRYYDVPLSTSLQDYIFEECGKYNIDPTIILAMIKSESNYDIDIIGDRGNSYGLMQIQPRWHEARMARLGCDNLLDPYQNVTIGIDILGELLGRGKGLEWALMAYNGGAGHANGHLSAGTVSTYVTKVMAAREDILGLS